MTEKVRVHEIAKELGIASKDVVKKASDMGIDIKSANSSVTMQEAENLMNYIMSGELAQAPKPEIKVDVKSASDTQKEEKTPQKEIKKSEVKTPVK
ncbi:MAG: translation initiation factor, partial [Campylobacterota bacterium]|nr:translation initiation factor [Campylobacterota bacterium]